ncbi:DUF2141 domain-containing protein [Brumimicrobium glaciale]|uniref:DUF2141 domain-containing protein n=1 Tax=Brumimicrobium glaciale TaxID=200475 RepID=A0A4Q4KRF9_9FLAO|nr:DUF2141 domain-containing protein [Brumimicrobium glaciale]RYM35645.1 DUF2141 domain-containing protein [Brumimicrobium glaciale]
MKNGLIIILFTVFSFSTFSQSNEYYDLKMEVKDLRNNTGVVQFALYNKNGSIPDEDYEKYFKIGKANIHSNSAEFTFKALKGGTYAINILHDENKNGEIDKGWILPIEGIGFSNFKSIGFSNRPNFEKASFLLNRNEVISITVIYM